MKLVFELGLFCLDAVTNAKIFLFMDMPMSSAFLNVFLSFPWIVVVLFLALFLNAVRPR